MLSLQSLCLDVIVKNFKKLHFAFTASKDAKLQQNMQFLQRRFSDCLQERLNNNRDIYYDFVINKHLKSVDFSWYGNRHPESIGDFFRRLPNLEIIRFTHCGDEILRSIAEFCPRIVEIDAGNSMITDQGIKYLCETKNGMLPCPELKHIVQIGITHKGAELLIRSLPSIEKLDHANLALVLHSINTENVSQHQKAFFCNLSYLSFRDCKKVPYFTEVIKSCLTVCPKLEELFCELSEKEQFDALANSHLCLKKLHLWFSQGSPNINVNKCFKACGRNLTFLSICRCTVSLSALAKHCPALEDLAVSDIHFTDDDQQPIFPSLIKYDFVTSYLGVRQSFLCLLPLLSPKVKRVKIASPVLYSEMEKQILMWCMNPAAKSIVFLDTRKLKISFLRDCLLNSSSVKLMAFFRCSYDAHNPKENLKFLADTLSNEPTIIVA